MKSPAFALFSTLSLVTVSASAQPAAAPEPAAKPAPAVKTAKAVPAATSAKAAPDAKAAADAKPVAAAPAPRTAADEARRKQPLATFEGGQLTVGDLEDAIERQSPMMRARYADPRNLKELYDKTLRFAVLSAEAERRGYAKNDSVVQAVKQNAVQALMKADFDETTAGLAVTKEEVKKHYDEHLEEYVQSALQRASIIVLKTDAEARALLPEAKAADLRAFRQLARDKSVDEATKSRGGDLRYFEQSGKVRDDEDAKVPPAVARAAFALKNVGDTAEQPVKVPEGFAIVKLTGSRPALSRKLPEAEESIRVRLWRERRQKAIEDFVAKLKAQHPTEVHPELSAAITLDELPAAPETPPGHDEAAEGQGEKPAADKPEEPEAP
jgi:peptidyl-prolyl cis-trans isomerase C